MNLDIRVQPGGSGPGADARATIVAPPTTALFLFEASGATLNTAAAASLTAFGTQCKSPDLLTRTGCVRFGARTPWLSLRSRRHDVSNSREPVLAVPAFGRSPAIAGAQWSVPVTRASPETLGDALGPGGIALSLAPGLEMRWAGRDAPADCEACQLVADPGTLTLAGLVARTTTLPHNIALWERARSSALTLHFPTLFPFRFVSDATGSETFGLKTAMSATLDQPKTINSERARLDGTGFFALEQTTTGTRLMTEVSGAEGAPTPAQSYAIRNALLKASSPSILTR